MRHLAAITYEPAREGEGLYRAECSECDAWEVHEGLAKARKWARVHVYEDHAPEESAVVSILKRLGWVA